MRRLSATENLMIFSRLLGLSRADARKRKAADLLEEFGLAEAASRPLAKFSGGMRRRLDLAASLIAQPPLIFLDEPTTGLDPRTRGQMWDTIRRLVATGSTVLLTTQYLDEADQLADRIAVIDRGQVVAEGTALELKASVGQASLHPAPRREGGPPSRTRRSVIARVLGVPTVVSPEAARLTVPMSNPDRVTDLLVAFREAGVHLSEFSVQQPSLDEVFLALTGQGVPEDDADAHATASELEASSRSDPRMTPTPLRHPRSLRAPRRERRLSNRTQLRSDAAEHVHAWPGVACSRSAARPNSSST